MKVLSWLGLMLCIVTLAFMALTLASASVVTSVKVIASEVDKSLVEGAIHELLEWHPMGSKLHARASGAPISDEGLGEGRGPGPEVHIQVERSPEGCTISDSVSWDIPIHRRVERLLFGEPSLDHLTPSMVGEALRQRWSNPERACLPFIDGSVETGGAEGQISDSTAVSDCDSCWAWTGLTSRNEAQALQSFLTRQGWALSDSAAFSWTVLADSSYMKQTGGTREDVTTFILYRPY